MTISLPRIVAMHDYVYCAQAVTYLLRDREERYPAAVTAAKMTAADAAEGLERLRCIAAQWKWIRDPSRPPLPPFNPETGEFGAFNYILAEEMDRIATNARTRADRDPSNATKGELADLCEALAWYQADCIPGVARVVMHVAMARSREGDPVAERLAA
jgi:hypothetical protein